MVFTVLSRSVKAPSRPVCDSQQPAVTEPDVPPEQKQLITDKLSTNVGSEHHVVRVGDKYFLDGFPEYTQLEVSIPSTDKLPAKTLSSSPVKVKDSHCSGQHIVAVVVLLVVFLAVMVMLGYALRFVLPI